MSRSNIELTPDLSEYMRSVSLREHPVLRRIRDFTGGQMADVATCQISAEEGQFLAMLVMCLGAQKTLEIGVFTGYSSTCVALALPSDGLVVACDRNEEYTTHARRFWAEAGVEKKIDLRIGPALATLDALLAAGEDGGFDFAFIDADKANYQNYFERALRLLRTGGVIAIDNVLWHGRVIDPGEQDEDTKAIRRFNEDLLKDDRVDISMVPIGDGVTLARKR